MDKNKRMGLNINTKGGSYIEGDIQAVKEIVGRDKIVTGDIIYGDKCISSRHSVILKNLLESITGWYNDIIERLHYLPSTSLKQNDSKIQRFNLGFDYIWRRDYVQKIIALREILTEQTDAESLLREIDNFVSVLIVSGVKIDLSHNGGVVE